MTVNVMKTMLSRRIQALLTLVTVGIAIYIGFANATRYVEEMLPLRTYCCDISILIILLGRTMDLARAPPPPGHHAQSQSTQMCLGVGPACIQDLKGEIQGTNLRMEERFRDMQTEMRAEMAAMEVRVGKKLANFEGGYPSEQRREYRYLTNTQTNTQYGNTGWRRNLEILQVGTLGRRVQP